jgi:integrase
MLAAEVPLKVISEMMGHATIGITADIYAEVIPNLQREAAGKLDRLLAVTKV